MKNYLQFGDQRWPSAVSFLWSVVLALVGSAFYSMPASAVEIRGGHAGHWYAPARSGEGWALEIIGPEAALLYWFTYDEDGNQRWLTAVGQIVSDEGSDQQIEFPELVVTRGGRFGPDFDPGEVEREDVGEGTLRFSSCDDGEFSYSAFGQSQTIAVQRLSRLMGGRCESLHGVPGRVVAPYAGQSGSWFDTTHNGEGYSLQWMSPEAALLTWYSYDTEGQQYWMLGVGELDEEGRLQFEDLHATRGARFGAAFDPDDVERFLWGRLTMELTCDGGSAQYESVIQSFGSGTFNLSRLTFPDGISCPWLAPKLTDIYEIDYRQVPIAQGNPMNPNRIEARAITDDGSVVAVRGGESGYTVLVFEEDAEDWRSLPLSGFAREISVGPEGDIFASHVFAIENNVVAMRWRSELDEWQLLANPLGYDRSRVFGASARATTVVGTGFLPGSAASSAWVLNDTDGLTALQFNNEISFATPLSASELGDVVVGRSIRQVAGVARPIAIRMLDGVNPEVLRDTSGADLGVAARCNYDCSLIFGTDQSIVNLQHPNARQAWYWKPDGDFAYLGRPVGSLPDGITTYGLLDVTDDGTMAIGDYVTGTATAEAFIWTQDTGLVSVGDLLEDLQIEASWSIRSATGVSSEGGMIVLSGEIRQTGMTTQMQAAVLTLQPR